MNKELNQFRHNISSMGESISTFRIYDTQVHNFAQATWQQTDIVQHQVTSIRSDLKEQIERAVHEVKTELKTETTTMLNKKEKIK